MNSKIIIQICFIAVVLCSTSSTLFNKKFGLTEISTQNPCPTSAPTTECPFENGCPIMGPGANPGCANGFCDPNQTTLGKCYIPNPPIDTPCTRLPNIRDCECRLECPKLAGCSDISHCTVLPGNTCDPASASFQQSCYWPRPFPGTCGQDGGVLLCECPLAV